MTSRIEICSASNVGRADTFPLSIAGLNASGFTWSFMSFGKGDRPPRPAGVSASAAIADPSQTAHPQGCKWPELLLCTIRRVGCYNGSAARTCCTPYWVTLLPGVCLQKAGTKKRQTARMNVRTKANRAMSLSKGGALSESLERDTTTALRYA